MYDPGDKITTQSDRDDEIDILDYWRVVVAGKKMILLVVCLITLPVGVITFFLPKIYQGKATIMPGSNVKSGAMALSPTAQMGIGLLGDLEGITSPSTQILAVLRSRTLAERMIEKYGLLKVLYADLWDEAVEKWKVRGDKVPVMEDAVKALLKVMTFSDNKKDRLIQITAELKDPQFAADLVNNYVKELARLLREKTFTSAKRNRIFLEEQLETNKAKLLEAGKELSGFYAQNRISNVRSSIDVDVSVDTGSRRPSAVGIIQTERDQMANDLQRQVRELDERFGHPKIVKSVPQQVYLQYLAQRRELLVAVNSLLAQQYELAKAEEAKDDLNFEIIDSARVPVRKFKPKRLQIAVTSFFLSVFLALSLIFLRDRIRRDRARV